MDKFEMQDNEYEFPYHHIPYTNGEKVLLSRKLYWGYDYMAIMQYTMEQIQEENKKNPVHSIIDVGCGDGAYIKEMRMNPLFQNISLKGVDLSERAIQFAKAFNPGVDIEVRDVTKMREQFDLVICNQVLEHIPDDMLNNFIKGLSNALKPNGLLLLSVPSTICPIAKKHYRHYTKQLLEKELYESGSDLEIERVTYITRKRKWVDLYVRLMLSEKISFHIGVLDQLIYRYIKKHIEQPKEYGKIVFAWIRHHNYR